MTDLLSKAFTVRKLHEKKVTFVDRDGQELEVVLWIKPETVISAVSQVTCATLAEANAHKIANRIVNQEGRPYFTADEILNGKDGEDFNASLALALIGAIYELDQEKKVSN